MDEQILFTERQHFKQWWLWVLLLGIDGLFLYGVYQQVIQGKQFGDHPMNNAGLLFATVAVLLISVFFISMRLVTKVTKEGISIHFFPFHTKIKNYPWSSVEQALVRKYSPLKEYGGWGVRYGASGTGNAYNVSGNYGIQLVFKDGSKLLIGTNKPQQAAEVLKRLPG